MCFAVVHRECGKVRHNLPAAKFRLCTRHCTSIFVENYSPRRYSSMRLTSTYFRLMLFFLTGLASFVSARAGDRVTILYDAFGNAENLKKDWGFSVLIEYSGKKILFDTGNNAKTFAANVKVMHVDLKDLDFVVISHRHGDHTSGLNYLLQVNPRVKIYVPAESFGVFGSTLPKGLYKTVDNLPSGMRYFNGADPEAFPS